MNNVEYLEYQIMERFGPGMLNIDQAAAICCKSPTTMRNLMWRGKGPKSCRPAGTKRHLFLARDLAVWVLGGQATGEAAETLPGALKMPRRGRPRKTEQKEIGEGRR